MRESDFIKQNKEKWLELEQILKQKERDSDKLSNLFIQVTDDLSYSKTFFKNRMVRVYLNNVAQLIFHNIYKNKKNRWKEIVLFWKEELPQIVYESRKELLVSLITFLIAAFIGALSYANEPEFAHVILGDSYIQMTNENIKSGDPMAVYKKMNQIDMFLGITFNNVFVAFRTFILGVFFAIGTIAMILYNGIMIGVFQYFFYQKGLFVESFLAIWLHGTLEISSIIIAGGAGLTLGKGLVFPGTYSRLQAFQLSARRGLKLLMGILPILVVAAIIESFLTRYTNAPNILRLIIIILSAIFIVGYFIWYPIKKAKNGFVAPIPEGKLAPDKNNKIIFTDIKSNGEIFKDVFILYRNKLKTTFLIVLSTSVIYTVLALLIYPTQFNSTFLFSNYVYVLKLFNYETFPSLALFNTIMLFVPMFFICFYIFNQSESDTANKKLTVNYFIKNFYKSLFASAAINLLIMLPTGLNVFLLIMLLPFILVWQFVMFKEQKSTFGSLSETFRLVNQSMGKLLGLCLMLSFICIIYFFFIDSPLAYFYLEILSWNLTLSTTTSTKLFNGLLLFTAVWALQMVIPIVCLGCNIIYFTLKEIKDANHLKTRIKNFGNATSHK